MSGHDSAGRDLEQRLLAAARQVLASAESTPENTEAFRDLLVRYFVENRIGPVGGNPRTVHRVFPFTYLYGAFGVSQNALEGFLEGGFASHYTVRQVASETERLLCRRTVEGADDAAEDDHPTFADLRIASLARFRQLASLLEGRVPESLSGPEPRVEEAPPPIDGLDQRTPIAIATDLPTSDYEALVAAVDAAIAYHFVAKWDGMVMTIVQLLVQMLNDAVVMDQAVRRGPLGKVLREAAEAFNKLSEVAISASCRNETTPC